MVFFIKLDTMKVLRKIDLGIGVLEFFENHVLGYVNLGVNFDQKERQLFLEACLVHFDDKPFGYVSVRKHSYSINPLIYSELNTVPSLKAFAIVSFSNICTGNAEIEERFYKKPFAIFKSTDEAQEWISTTVASFK